VRQRTPSGKLAASSVETLRDEAVEQPLLLRLPLQRLDLGWRLAPRLGRGDRRDAREQQLDAKRGSELGGDGPTLERVVGEGHRGNDASACHRFTSASSPASIRHGVGGRRYSTSSRCVARRSTNERLSPCAETVTRSRPRGSASAR
jgi:hypothetical protein